MTIWSLFYHTERAEIDEESYSHMLIIVEHYYILKMDNSNSSPLENPTPAFKKQYIQEINKRRKLKGTKPKFVISSSQVQQTCNDEQVHQSQIITTIKHLQMLILSCLDKTAFQYMASWCRVLRIQKVQQIFVVVLNGVSDEYYLKNLNVFVPFKQLFTSDDICQTFRFLTLPNMSFLQQMLKMPAKKRIDQVEERSSSTSRNVQTTSMKRSYDDSDMIKNQQENKILKLGEKDEYSRVKLLLNLKQMLCGNYPCPILNQFQTYKRTKQLYQPVTDKSPIFAVDVETIILNDLQVPYWMSIVDENLECCYQALIKPLNKNSNSKYEDEKRRVQSMLPNIYEKTLHEVQHDLSIHLPDDAILTGHSIENDLKYLQIYHPYLIDTSIIYNVSGLRLHKSSLQQLYAIYFGQIIQGQIDHDPTEDARATMALVKLKLSKDIRFGDWFLGGVDQLTVVGQYDKLVLNENEEKCQQFMTNTKFGLQDNFFDKVKSHK
ncbi:unnamed protein product, partial [Didymodactylos carnosus]